MQASDDNHAHQIGGHGYSHRPNHPVSLMLNSITALVHIGPHRTEANSAIFKPQAVGQTDAA